MMFILFAALMVLRFTACVNISVTATFEEKFDHYRCERIKECRTLDEAKINETSNDEYCLATADFSMMCLPRTRRGQTITIHCQSGVGNLNVSRTCNHNGDWENDGFEHEPDLCSASHAIDFFHSKMKITGKEEYLLIFQLQDLTVDEVVLKGDGTCKNLYVTKEPFVPIFTLLLVLGIQSCIFSFLGFLILSWLYTSKNCRIRIHRHLFASLFFWNLIEVLFYHFYKGGTTTCTCLYFTMQFFYSSTIVWLVMEGLHHFWIIYYTYKDPLKFKVFFIIGYGTSFLQTFGFYLPATLATGGPSECTTGQFENNTWDKIFFVFSYGLLIINLLVFCYLLVILKRKIKRENNSTARKSLRLARSWLILLILLGGGFYTGFEASSNKGVVYFQLVLSGLQAFFLFLTQVILSKDVQKKMRNKWRIHKQKNILPPLDTKQSLFALRLPRMNSSKTYVVNSLTRDKSHQNTKITCTTGVVNEAYSGPEVLQDIKKSSNKEILSTFTNDEHQQPVENGVNESKNLESEKASSKEDEEIDTNDEAAGIDNDGFVKDDTDISSDHNVLNDTEIFHKNDRYYELKNDPSMASIDNGGVFDSKGESLTINHERCNSVIKLEENDLNIGIENEGSTNDAEKDAIGDNDDLIAPEEDDNSILEDLKEAKNLSKQEKRDDGRHENHIKTEK